MKKYHVAAGDGKGYYGVGYESYLQATELLKISQRHDPKAHIVEEEYHFTHADRIRAMSDDELSYAIMKVACGVDPAVSFCQRKKECEDLMEADKEIPDEWCRQCVLDMLRKPVDVTEHHITDTTGKDYSGLLEE